LCKNWICTKLGEKPIQGCHTDLIGTKRHLDASEPSESIYGLVNKEPHFRLIAKYSNSWKSIMLRTLTASVVLNNNIDLIIER
jgi:hypothetical protein